MGFGATLRSIRRNRNLTQKELIEGIVQQGTYSRIEQDQLQISAELLVQLVERLNISLNEFLYIHHQYEATEREKILKDYREMELTLPKEIKDQLRIIERYLKKQPDDGIKLLFDSYRALLILTEEDDLEAVRAIAENIWERVQKLDHWYIEDMELLNSIIVLFPLDTAIQITTTAIKRLNAYDDYERDVTYLKIYFHLNLTLLYLENEQYEACIEWLDRTYKKFKRKLTYQSLGYIFTHKTICHIHLKRPYEEELRRLETLMDLFDDQEVLSLLLEEIAKQKAVFELKS
ncbi:helix-turn-helix domain-containing protein [Lysinibacillus odysseyi]|uniref:HTH cro/C1-type domain-containing protein n=1 Tax=Lysinibacillus odysseyi 34hs-1 = NBRC 100172 TaxID=1220589 RepID=A0A0A3II76_9BACI|nr:helix-turn-helix transcriptional regulator [Lysinibacillus odysseyi]KGR84409.1 hypothetical protein CD32_12520 [Lysinibacillus odysseyi 34hs-1 = NBRC 100172]